MLKPTKSKIPTAAAAAAATKGKHHEIPRHDESSLKLALAAAKEQAEKLTHQGFLEDAMDRRNDVLEFVSSLYGSQSVQAVEALHELGLLFYDMSRYPESVKTFEKAAMSYQGGGLDQPKLMGNILLGLGISKYALGEYHASIGHYRNCVDLLEREYGKHYPGLVSALVNLALSRCALRDAATALQDLKKAQRVCENVLGTDRLQLSDVFHNIGTCLEQLGKDNEALDYYKRALAIREKARVADDMNTAGLMENIANILSLKAQTQKDAVIYLLRALKLRQTLQGDNDSRTIESKLELGLLYARMGCKKEAMKTLKAALDCCGATGMAHNQELYAEARRVLRICREG